MNNENECEQAFRKYWITDEESIKHRESFQTAWTHQQSRINKFKELLEVQMAVRAHMQGLKIIELPSVEPKRIGGERKMNPILNGISVSKSIIKEFLK